ncbi:hypothetical protein QOZ80_5BG0432570 [Eleusine coracana subsp. coracana]|nr:hypothetical protein QOZ80_5BG0432570 [Eleusine coracana subsp. coracana]
MEGIQRLLPYGINMPWPLTQIHIFQGNLSLQGSTLCKWYANPALPEVSALQDSCFGHLPPPTIVGPVFFEHEPERISVAQLSAFMNPHLIYNNRYIIKAKIKQVLPNQSWWYHACDSCRKTIQQQGSAYRCTGVQCTSTVGSPRYRLPVMVVDPDLPPTTSNVPSVEVVFFGPTTEEIIGAPVDTLIASSSGVGAFLPTKITALYGKVYELRVSVSPGSLQRINITYQVDGVIGLARPALAPVQPRLDQPQQTAALIGESGTTSQHQTSVPSSTPAEPSGAKNDRLGLLPHTNTDEGTVMGPAIALTATTSLNQDEQAAETAPIKEAAEPTSISMTTQVPNTPPTPTTPVAEQVTGNTKTAPGPQKRSADELEDDDYDQGKVKKTSIRRNLRMPHSPPNE